jgi:hypothetical protein
VRTFTDLFRILAEHDLSVPPEIAGAFRALATIEGTLTRADLARADAAPAPAPPGPDHRLPRGRTTRSQRPPPHLYAFLGYCLLVFAGILALRVRILALRVLVLIFRLDAG